MNVTRLCLVRHGETDWNLAQRIQGSLDIPLNATGIAQAEAAAAALAKHRFDRFYSSDLARAQQTAKFISAKLGLLPQLDARLRERDYGVLQGLSRDEAAIQYPDMLASLRARQLNFDPIDSEPLPVFIDRVQGVLAEFAQREAGKTTLAVSHGHFMDACYRLAAPQPFDIPRTWKIENAAINWLWHDGQRWHIEAWNQNAHLNDALDENTPA